MHLSLVDPEPDGVVTQFAVPDTNLVSGTVKPFLEGELLTIPEYDPDADPVQTQYIDLTAGRIVLSAPDEGDQLRVTYSFQWFTDQDLATFLVLAAQLLGFTSVEASGLSVQLRTPVLSFAAYYAYLKMAANSAQALSASAAGFEGDNTKEHPYWMDLAKDAWATAQKELEMVATNVKPHMRFVNFRLQRYVPRS